MKPKTEGRSTDHLHFEDEERQFEWSCLGGCSIDLSMSRWANTQINVSPSGNKYLVVERVVGTIKCRIVAITYNEEDAQLIASKLSGKHYLGLYCPEPLL